MQDFSIGRVIATGTLAFALTFVLQVRAESAPQAEAPAAPAKHDPHYTPPPTPAVRDLLLSIDQSVLLAWQKGDAKKLDSLMDWDAKVVDGAATGADQILDKAQFLTKAKSVHLPKTLVASARAVRMSGGEPSDVALVTGTLTDSAIPADTGTAYSAVYLRTYLPSAVSPATDPKTWVLVRYQTSPHSGAPLQYVASPLTPWSPDDFAPSQKRIVSVVLSHIESLLQKDSDTLAKTVSDDFSEVHAIFPTTTHSRTELLAQLADPRPAPMGGSAPTHVLEVDKPEVKILGVYSQTAIVTLVVRRGPGGVIYGSDDFKPPWRGAFYDTFVLDHPHSDWQIAYHQATVVNP